MNLIRLFTKLTKTGYTNGGAKPANGNGNGASYGGQQQQQGQQNGYGQQQQNGGSSSYGAPTNGGNGNNGYGGNGASSFGGAVVPPPVIAAPAIAPPSNSYLPPTSYDQGASSSTFGGYGATATSNLFAQAQQAGIADSTYFNSAVGAVGGGAGSIYG